MPMCDCGVPDRHTTAVKLVEDRREEGRAGVGHARDDTFGRGVHQREHVVGRRKPAPCTAHRRGREHADADCADRFRRRSRARNLTRYDPAPCPPTRVFDADTLAARSAPPRPRTDRGRFGPRGRRRPSSTAAGLARHRCASRSGSRPKAARCHDDWARVAAGSETEEAVDPRLRTLPAAERGVPPALQRLAGPAGQRAQRPRRCRVRLGGHRPPAHARRAGRAGPAPRRPCTSIASTRIRAGCARR